MRLLNNIRFKTKLPLLMALVTVACLAVAIFISYSVSSKRLTQEIDNRLRGTADSRAELIHSWATSVRSDVMSLSNSPATVSAMAEFSHAFDGVDTAKAKLQKLYVTDNPNPTGEKDKFDDAGDGSEYSWRHSQYHPFYRSIQQERGYYDIFLISMTGDVVYTVYKELDYASNVDKGDFADSGLGRAFRAARDLPAGEEIAFDDFNPYEPSFGAPASFVARPIFDENDRKIGVIAFQLPIDRMQTIIGDRQGLSETTDIVVVASDLTSRSASVLGDTAPIMTPVSSNAAISAALSEKSGVDVIIGNNGVEYKLAYQPIDFFGTTWAMLAAEPMDVVMSGVIELLQQLLIAGTVILIVAVAICFFAARSISVPLIELARTVNKVNSGDYTCEIPGTSRRDELGGIGRALRDLQRDMGKFNAGARENLFKSAAFSGTSAAMMITDKDFNISFANATSLDLLRQNEELFRRNVPGGEFNADEIVGKNMDIFHKDPSHQRKLLEDPVNFPYDADIQLENLRLSLRIAAVKDETGAVFGYVVEWNDVTAESLNASILEALDANQCGIQFNGDGKVDIINAKLRNILGTHADGFMGKTIDSLFKFNPELAKSRGHVWDRLKSGEAIYGKFKIEFGNGEVGWLEGGFSPVFGKRKNLVRVAFIGADRTETESALIEAENRRREMERAQSLVVDQLQIALKRMADGDLTTTIDAQFKPEYEALRNDFNSSIEQLRSSMQGVAETSDAINTDVASIAEAADDLSKRTERQAATLEETAAALDQLTASVRHAAAGAVEADKIVGEARESARASGEIVGQTVQAMSKIEDSSQQISKIISVIDDIAFQTNLLALNAGVEAARAGDAGRGFAVVASEVRALAQRSSEAAKEIGTLITESTHHVQHGVRLVDQTGHALEQIVSSVGNISGHVSQIAQSAQEQSSGLAEINTAVNQLDQTTQQNAAMFEETTAASNALLRESTALSSTVARFNLGTSMSSMKSSNSERTITPPAKTIAPKKSLTTSTNATAAKQVKEVDGWEDF